MLPECTVLVSMLHTCLPQAPEQLLSLATTLLVCGISPQLNADVCSEVHSNLLSAAVSALLIASHL